MKNSMIYTVMCLAVSSLGGCASGIQVMNEGGRFAQVMPITANEAVVEFETYSNERCIQMAKNTAANSGIKMRCSPTSAMHLNGHGEVYNRILGERMRIKTLTYESCKLMIKSTPIDAPEMITCIEK